MVPAAAIMAFVSARLSWKRREGSKTVAVPPTIKEETPAAATAGANKEGR